MTTEEKFNNWWHKHHEPANGQKDDLYTGKETITMPASMYKDDIKSAYTAGLREATKECNEYYQNELDEVYKDYAKRLEAQKETIASYDADLNKAKKQIEKMKCCQNCKHSIEEYGEFTCPFTKDNNFCSIAYNTENNSLWELKE